MKPGLDALAPGERLGAYVLEEPIGRGGFAVVWRAGGPTGPVAIKFLEPRAASDRANAHRFAVELETLSRLEHPAIARCFGSLEHLGMPAIVMEYVDGITLRADMLKRSQLGEYFAWTEISDIVTQVLGALAAAHKAGVVHRDLKPSNIVLGGDPPRVVLLDFGVAKLTGADHFDETTMGRPIGTLHYMAPEQHQSVGVGPTADLFAAGVLLFELVTLRRPWLRDLRGQLAPYHDQAATTAEENNYPAILFRVSKEPRPSLEHLRLDAPLGILTLIHCAISQEPARRPQTAEEFLAAFQRALQPSRHAGSLEPPRAVHYRFDEASKTVPQPVDALRLGEPAQAEVPALLVPSLTPRVVPVELSDPDAEQVLAIASGAPKEPARSEPRRLAQVIAPAGPDLTSLVADVRRWIRATVLTGAASGALVTAFVTLAMGLRWSMVGLLVASATLLGFGATHLALRVQRRRSRNRFRAMLAASSLFRWERKNLLPGGAFEFQGAESRYAKTSDSVHLTVMLRGSDPHGVARAPIRVVIEKPARSDIRFLMRRWEEATGIPLVPGHDGSVACPVREMTSQLVAEKLVIRDQDLKLLVRETLAAFAEEIVFTASGIRMTIHVPGDVSAEHQVLSVYRACALFSSLYWWGETQGR